MSRHIFSNLIFMYPCLVCCSGAPIEIFSCNSGSAVGTDTVGRAVKYDPVIDWRCVGADVLPVLSERCSFVISRRNARLAGSAAGRVGVGMGREAEGEGQPAWQSSARPVGLQTRPDQQAPQTRPADHQTRPVGQQTRAASHQTKSTSPKIKAD